MNSINKVILIGNCGKDPEIKQSKLSEFATFSLATNERWKDKATQELKEKAEWHNIIVFNPVFVKICKDYIKKGSNLYIEGMLRTRKWESDNNDEKYITEIVIKSFDSKLIVLSKINKDNDEEVSGNNLINDENNLNEYNRW